MLERFYDPLEGSISLDGTNIKDINVQYLRGLIGYVGQEPTLFATSIRQNISYGNPGATQEQIEEAAKLANAHDFITSLPDGYDTQVGDKGGQLSGGQKQRVAIARVLVGDPKVLLLDEATSALDAESELVVQEALDNILDKKKITTIVIAHRLSTIRNADTINVVVNGKVAEMGTHDQLMGQDSYYRRLVEKQEGTGEASASSSNPPSRSNSVAGGLDRMDSAIVAGSTHGGVAHIAFKNVVFAYPTRPRRKVMNHFSLNINRGETVALVGPSGGGKSTTVGLIERFYDVAEGSVEYLGVDIRTLNVSWYRDQIGYVGQEPVLFNDTIARNITYGAPNATREEIEEACRQANCYDFIKEFPEGLDTLVGERGIQVSGGQKQRIAIARALVKKPQLLILDEATSALDNESEAVVQAAIDKLMESRQHTVILIAHRLSTIRNADKIAVVAHGHVVEFGSHDELIEKEDGRYRRLFDSSKRGSTLESVGLIKSSVKEKSGKDDEDEEEINWEEKINEEEDIKLDAARARKMASQESFYFFIGIVGAIFSGGVFPMWGVLFSETINLLFRRVERCPDDDGLVPLGFDTCEEYWKDIADDMQDRSFTVSIYWALVFFGCVLGALMNFYGFGTASENISKRVRDSCFEALIRQEVAYFGT
jgi:ATP-binding cassette subfamily B (MDR/TAP) protein 1